MYLLSPSEVTTSVLGQELMLNMRLRQEPMLLISIVLRNMLIFQILRMLLLSTFMVRL